MTDPSHGVGLIVTRVQAVAHQLDGPEQPRPTNYLVALHATDADGAERVGLGEGQPRGTLTGDGSASWRYVETCVSTLRGRTLEFADNQGAIEVVSSVMRELVALAEDHAGRSADDSVPFRGTRLGFEVALLDLAARALDCPLAALLGAKRARVTVHAPEVRASQRRSTRMRLVASQSPEYPAIRLQGEQGVARNVRLLEATCEATDQPIWIDLGSALSADAAGSLLDSVSAAIHDGRLPASVVLENPVKPDDSASLLRLQARASTVRGDVAVMADASTWVALHETTQASRRFPLGRRRVKLPRAVRLRPALFGGVLASIDVASQVIAARPDARIVLSGMPGGGTKVTASTLRNLAMALPAIDSLADDSVADETRLTVPTSAGLGVAPPYAEVIAGARQYAAAPALPAPTYNGLQANVYDEVEFLRQLGANGTKGHLLEREALALGLSTTRFDKGAFMASDGVQPPLAFKWSRSPVSSGVALALCTHKEATRLRLSHAGVPVPEGSTFAAGDVDAARGFAQELGFPLVVKPAMGVRGIGVMANIRDDETLDAAFDQLESSKLGKSDFIVERHISGCDYRIVVIGDEVVGAILREPASVEGDGVRTIAELVIAKNVARRGNPHLGGRPIKYDKAARFQLRRAGLSLDYVPQPGERVLLSSSCSLSQGGDSIDVLDELHPTIEEAAIRAVRSIPGLTFCGVDFLLEDHSKPLDSQEAGICELNAHAAIGNCEYPLYGTPREVARALLDRCVSEYGLAVADERAKTLSLHLEIKGRVTHVGYRAWLRRRALATGVTGWAKNVNRKTVEAVLVGPAVPVAALAAAAVLGPPKAFPTSVTTTHVEPPDLDGFTLVADGTQQKRRLSRVG